MRFSPWLSFKDDDAEVALRASAARRHYAAAAADPGGGGASTNSAVVGLVVGATILAAFLVLGFAYAFRGRQTGAQKSRVGEPSAANRVYGFEGLQNYSPSFVTASLGGVGGGAAPANGA
jgi:hypothetical protein